MSFSQKVKGELARVFPTKKCCCQAELTALLDMGGRIDFEDQTPFITFETGNASVIRKVCYLSEKLFKMKKEISVRKKLKLKKNNLYTAKIIPQSITGESPLEGLDLNKRNIKRLCCQKSYLRGTFLGGGSMSDPRQGDYHLEMVIDDMSFNFIIDIMEKFECKPGIYKKRKSIILYLKDSERIINFLNAVGAHSALLYFEDVRVRKDVINKVNRLVNCETANLNKSVDAGLQQIENINYLARMVGLSNLPSGLGQLAAARLENPEASLRELGELMEPPLSKSAVNHRMRRLNNIAEKMKGN